MVKEIVKDPLFLSKKSENATQKDLGVAIDLIDTLKAHEEECVGMAANMIGVLKKVIIFYDEDDDMNKVMFNPVIVYKAGEYDTEEGCLSLPGKRKTKRYEKIVVEYFDMSFKKHKATYKGFTAQIIQHEVDMTEGILI